MIFCLKSSNQILEKMGNALLQHPVSLQRLTKLRNNCHCYRPGHCQERSLFMMQEIAVLRKKYFSVVNPPPQTMWPNCVSSKRERPQKMHLRLKIDFLILKTREGLAPSYHYDMIIIADISHYRYHQRKGTFFKAVHFWADITQKMLSRIFALLVYFLQAQIMQWCTGIEKYLVCIL